MCTGFFPSRIGTKGRFLQVGLTLGAKARFMAPWGWEVEIVAEPAIRTLSSRKSGTVPWYRTVLLRTVEALTDQSQRGFKGEVMLTLRVPGKREA